MDKKKNIVILVLTITIIVGTVMNINVFTTAKFSADNKKIASWKEIPIKFGTSFAKCSGMKEFDLKKTIMESDYVFSGRIINMKEYKVEWVDDNGEPWGPFPSSVLEVEITHEYAGKSQVKDNVIKVYYPYSLSTVYEGAFIIKDKAEYVFVTRALDEAFVERRQKEAPDDKFEQEKYADVYISNPCYSIMPIDKGRVFMYNDYFSWDKDVMMHVKTGESVETDRMSSTELIDTGWFIALDKKDFNEAFLKLFKNPKEIPNVSELQRLKKINITQKSISE